MMSQATATLRRDGNCHAAGVAARGREALLSIGSSSCLLVLPVRVFRVFQVPERAAAHGHLTSCPAEKSGQEEFDFEYGEDFATHIGAFQPTFCKVLVRYNPEGDPALNRRQAARLHQLSAYLHGKSQSRFMFELLVPAEKA